MPSRGRRVWPSGTPAVSRIPLDLGALVFAPALCSRVGGSDSGLAECCRERVPNRTTLPRSSRGRTISLQGPPFSPIAPSISRHPCLDPPADMRRQGCRSARCCSRGYQSSVGPSGPLPLRALLLRRVDPASCKDWPYCLELSTSGHRRRYDSPASDPLCMLPLRCSIRRARVCTHRERLELCTGGKGLLPGLARQVSSRFRRSPEEYHSLCSDCTQARSGLWDSLTAHYPRTVARSPLA